MKRGLTPSSQAEIQRPEPVHDLRPAGAPAGRVTAPAQNVEHVAHDGCRFPGVDSGRTGGGTDLDASRAAGAAVEDFAHSNVERGDECVTAVHHSFTQTCRWLTSVYRYKPLHFHVDQILATHRRLCQTSTRPSIIKARTWAICRAAARERRENNKPFNSSFIYSTRTHSLFAAVGPFFEPPGGLLVCMRHLKNRALFEIPADDLQSDW